MQFLYQLRQNYADEAEKTVFLVYNLLRTLGLRS